VLAPGSTGADERLTVVSGQPLTQVLRQARGVALQFREVVKGVGAAQFARAD
jgi:hypothetical protein